MKSFWGILAPPAHPKERNIGVPTIRESKEIFEKFFQSGKSGENREVSAKIRGKIFKSGNFFSKPFSKLLNLLI